MKLLVVRHAIAEDMKPGQRDKDRPISKKGHKRFQQICKGLDHLNLKFDLLLDSPLLRSQQTADIFCKYFSVETRERSENLKPLAEPSEMLLEIRSYNKDDVVIVGHQPFLASFISHCIIEDERFLTLLKRGSVAFLNFPSSVQPGSAIIEALLQPKFLIE